MYKEFNPLYWHVGTMNFNNTLVPSVQATQCDWHGGDYPSAYVYAKAIEECTNLEIHFQGQTYKISQDLKDWVDGHPDEGEGGEFAICEDADQCLVGIVYDE